jgi:hypothetical protein
MSSKHWNWPTVHPQHPGDVVDFVASVAMRQDNRVRFANHRLMLKMYRTGK